MQQQPMQQPMQQPPPIRPMGPRKRGGFGRVFFVLLVLLASGFYVYNTLMPAGGRQTAVLQSGSIGASYEGEALIVRNEQVVSEEGVSNVSYIAVEGDVVYSGSRICTIYTTGYNQRIMKNLQDARDDLRDHMITLRKEDAVANQAVERQDENVLEKASEVAEFIRGKRANMLNLEQLLATAMDERQYVMENEYGGDTNMVRLLGTVKSYFNSIAGYQKNKVANGEYVVSFYTDGYEPLSTATMNDYDTHQVRSMIGGQKPEVSTTERGRTNVYRLVNRNNWGVFLLVKDTTFNPAQGEVFKLRLERFQDTIVDATVISTTIAGGELLVRLDVSSDVKDVLYMRTCKAEIGKNVDILVAPRDFLYRRENAQGQMVDTLVVMNESGQMYSYPVEVRDQDANYIYVVPLDANLYPGQTIVKPN